MLGYKVYYDKKTKKFCYESETSEVRSSDYNKDTDIEWFDTLVHAVNAVKNYNQLLMSNSLMIKTCKDCKRRFCIDINELEWLKGKNLKPYTRCYDCRQKRKRGVNIMNLRNVYIVVDGKKEGVPIGKESDEEQAIATGEDDQIYGYVPDDLFNTADDATLASFVEKNLV